MMYILKEFENENFIKYYEKINDNKQEQEKIIKNIIMDEIKYRMNNKITKFSSKLKNIIIYNFLLVKEEKMNCDFANWFIEELSEILNIYELTDFFDIFNNDLLKLDFINLNIDKSMLLKIFNHLLKNIPKSDNSLLRGKILINLSSILDYNHLSGVNKKGLISENNYKLDEESNENFYINFWETIEKINKNLTSDSILNNILNILNYINSNSINIATNIIERNPIILSNEIILKNQLNDTYFRKTLLIQFSIYFNEIKNNEFYYKKKSKIENLNKELLKLYNVYSLEEIINLYDNSNQKWVKWKENNCKNKIKSSKNLKNIVDNKFIKETLGLTKSDKLIKNLKKTDEESLKSINSSTYFKIEDIYDSMIENILKEENPLVVKNKLKDLIKNDVKNWRNLKFLSTYFIKLFDINDKNNINIKDIPKKFLIYWSNLINSDLTANFEEKLNKLTDISESMDDLDELDNENIDNLKDNIKEDEDDEEIDEELLNKEAEKLKKNSDFNEDKISLNKRSN